MKLPSKELLSEVLERDAFVRGLNQNGKTLRYCFVESHNRKREINIAELALIKCKEWAINKGYVVWSGSKHKLQGFNCCLYSNHNEIDEDFTADTEPEAIFKACEYILKELSNK